MHLKGKLYSGKYFLSIPDFRRANLCNKKNIKINEVTYEYLMPPCPPNERALRKMLR